VHHKIAPHADERQRSREHCHEQGVAKCASWPSPTPSDFGREPDIGHFRVRETRSSIRVRVSSQLSPGTPAMAA
jgi:hypothetical protein